MKQRIRLSESTLHRVIKESVRRILREMSEPKRKFYTSNGYATSDVFEATYEEAIYQCLKDVNPMCTVWLFELGGGEIGRTHKVNYYTGESFFSNEDGKEYVALGGKLECIGTWKD